MNRFFWFHLINYCLVLLLLVIYSYSQIDLNLTLSSNSLYQTFQKQLIYLGYFNRPFSATIFIIILFLLFSYYIYFIKLVRKGFLSSTQIILIILSTVLILFISYPAFSHDVFNYLFDARIVTKYHLNPYFFKANDFPDDLWVRFMHWTHRTYPYGPVWLLITLPFSYLGMGKFVLTLLSFKIMFTFFHIGNIFVISKILKKITPRSAYLGTVFYALNPLILIESLVSPHNEVIMLFFLLLSIYSFFIKNNKVLGLINLAVSAGVKFVTAALLPVFLFFKAIKTKKNFLVQYWLMIVLLIITTAVEIYYREPYPWYFIVLLGIGALLSYNRDVLIVLCGLSIGSLLRYAPYLYYGDYSSTVQLWQNWIFSSSIILSLIIVLIQNSTKIPFIGGKIRQNKLWKQS